MAMYTDQQIRYQLELHGGKAHSKEYIEKWDEIDEVVNRDHDIRLPEVVNDTEGNSLRRLWTRTNYAGVIINSTVTMTLSSGIKVYGEDGTVEEKGDRIFNKALVRRLIRYMSRYGAAWILRRPQDKKLPFRVYKPHIAREIPLEGDVEVTKAVLAIEEIKKRAAKDASGDDSYLLARWYEWVDSGKDGASLEPDQWAQVKRITYRSDDKGAAWTRLVEERTFTYMPMQLVRNHDADRLYDASDVIDGIELFRQMDDLTTKFIKALEDEAFRQTFFANVTAEQMREMEKVGALNYLFASNPPDHPEPKVYWSNPADHTQYLEAFADLMKRIATVTRTSPLELDERPVQDIPAQTLRVLYGPQIERCTETVEFAGPALSELRALIRDEVFDPLGDSRVTLEPRLPISEDKAHQNAKGLLDSNAYSRVQLLIDTGKPRAEAERIVTEALEEMKRIAQIEADIEMELEDKRAETQKEITKIQGEVQVEVAKNRPTPAA